MTVALFSCDKKEPETGKGKLNPNAMITIKSGLDTKATIEGLTALEVVQQALNIKWQSHFIDNVYSEEPNNVERSFNEHQKDFKTPALKMFGVEIITKEGEYKKDFINSFNVVITDKNNDTIAYIPNAIIDNARTDIGKAFNDKNYTEVYKLFDEAFVFVPFLALTPAD